MTWLIVICAVVLLVVLLKVLTRVLREHQRRSRIARTHLPRPFQADDEPPDW